jgi:DNA-binding MarR family transcriptional regulator
MNTPTYLTGTTQAQAYRLLRSRVYDVLSEYHLTPTHWSMLGLIYEASNGLRASEIAASMHVKAPLVTMITRELISQKYVVSVPHQFDGRAKLLAITPAGKNFVKIIETAMRGVLEKLLEGLTESDLDTYYKVLQTMIQNAQVE